MEAIHQIVTVKDHTINITLPLDFSAEEVEVIIFPTSKNEKNSHDLLENDVKKTIKITFKNASISQHFLDIMKEMEIKS